jgi:F-type H+-transporting ATPase subunit alpha
MKQKQYAPLSTSQMGVVLYAANEGYLNDIEVAKIQDFESALLSYMGSEHSDLMNEINASGSWNKDIEGTFKSAVEKFKATQTW